MWNEICLCVVRNHPFDLPLSDPWPWENPSHQHGIQQWLASRRLTCNQQPDLGDLWLPHLVMPINLSEWLLDLLLISPQTDLRLHSQR